jgi:hypothetical protein
MGHRMKWLEDGFKKKFTFSALDGENLHRLGLE